MMDDAQRRKANVRTALAFLSIAVVFFAGIIGARLIGDTAVGIGAMSVAVLAFLAFAIGRSLHMSEGGASQGLKGASPSDCGGRPRESIDGPAADRGPPK